MENSTGQDYPEFYVTSTPLEQRNLRSFDHSHVKYQCIRSCMLKFERLSQTNRAYRPATQTTGSLLVKNIKIANFTYTPLEI